MVWENKKLFGTFNGGSSSSKKKFPIPSSNALKRVSIPRQVENFYPFIE